MQLSFVLTSALAMFMATPSLACKCLSEKTGKNDEEITQFCCNQEGDGTPYDINSKDCPIVAVADNAKGFSDCCREKGGQKDISNWLDSDCGR